MQKPFCSAARNYVEINRVDNEMREQANAKLPKAFRWRKIRLPLFITRREGYASNPLLPPAEKPLAQSPVTKTRPDPGFKVPNMRVRDEECRGRTCKRVDACIRATTRGGRSGNCAVAATARRHHRHSRRRVLLVVVVVVLVLLSSSRSSSKASTRRRGCVTHWETTGTVVPRLAHP